MNDSWEKDIAAHVMTRISQRERSTTMSTSNASTVFRNLNSTQLKTLAIAPKPTSLLSIAGSSYIIGKIILSERVSNVRGGRGHCTYTNLLLGLSFADLITAIAYFLTTWPIPKDNIYSDYIWGEVGNQTTCNIQGENNVLLFFMNIPINHFFAVLHGTFYFTFKIMLCAFQALCFKSVQLRTRRLLYHAAWASETYIDGNNQNNRQWWLRRPENRNWRLGIGALAELHGTTYLN